MENIIGQSIEAVKGMNLDFGTSYPTVEDGIVTGTVDGNYPESFNGGNWEIVDDFYAVATNGE
jgi:hypothetical protein